MTDFKILEKPNDGYYFNTDNSFLDFYESQGFSSSMKAEFINELGKSGLPNRQVGYSKSRDCDYLYLLLVIHEYGDGEFIGHSIKRTYLTEKDSVIEDSHHNEDMQGELAHTIKTIYHPLPDGKLIEYPVKKKYQVELSDIYHMIIKVRHYYVLEESLTAKNSDKTHKRKI